MIIMTMAEHKGFTDSEIDPGSRGVREERAAPGVKENTMRMRSAKIDNGRKPVLTGERQTRIVVDKDGYLYASPGLFISDHRHLLR